MQSVPLTEFDELDAGDILFIDSSHVSKTGSDVNFLYFQVLPRLKPGVHIHIHDIFFPHDYPPEWVIGERRSWNEHYIVHALLMYSSGFRVEFACNYAFNTFPQLVGEALRLPNERAFGGASLWITKLAAVADRIARRAINRKPLVEIAHAKRIRLDECAARFDFFAHQRRENLFRRDRVLDLHLEQSPRLGIHCRFP